MGNTNFNKELFGQMLKQKAKDKNYCMAGVADDLQISRRQVCKWTTDIDPQEPSVSSLYKACKWLGVPMETFFVG